MDLFDRLLVWYGEHKRDLPWRHGRDAYGVWVSEIMLQQTRAQAVAPYYLRFMEALPSVSALAAVDDDALYKLWQGLGYYSRARNLKRAVVMVTERFGGVIPADFETLLTLPGVGAYTAGAIASIAYGARVPAVDGNVLRVYARLTDDDRDVLTAAYKKEVFERLRERMPADGGAFNQAMMDLGATVCLPNGDPLCARCPLASGCLGYQNGRAAALPVRHAKKERRIERKTVFVLENGGSFLIGKRLDTGLLAGLYELPNLPGHLTQAEINAALTAWELRPQSEIAVYAMTHIFTHIEWHMQVVRATVARHAPAPYRWYDGAQALPTAFMKCLNPK